MFTLLNSFFLVALSEMGDKTQLLALILASRFKKPWTVMSGILVATLLNHALASWVGTWVSQTVSQAALRYSVAALFLLFAVWMLVPDSADDTTAHSKFGPFLTTVVTFFLAEMGDKTQLATVGLGAQFQAPVLVTLGTTLGMLVADGFAVFLGERLTRKVSLPLIRKLTAALFALFGIGVFLGS